MPVRNGAACIASALESLLAQSYPAIEITVCDNASDDRTAEIVGRIAADDPRVVLKRFGEGVAIQQSYRRALETARGPYFLFAPADDVWAKGFVAEAVRHMQAHPEAAVCCGRIELHDGTGRRWLSKGTRPVAGPRHLRWIRALFATADANRLYGLIRKDALVRLIPGTDPEGWDQYAATKLALHGEISFIDVPAMQRGQTPNADYRRLIARQEPTRLGRAFYMRHVVRLFRQDPDFDTSGLRARAALLGFLLRHTTGSLRGPVLRPVRWGVRLLAGALEAVSRRALP